MHNLYSALEELMEEVAKTFENTVEDIAKYHRELLKRMLINVYRIRPAFGVRKLSNCLMKCEGSDIYSGIHMGTTWIRKK